MKPIPDLDDAGAMAAKGRRSALMSSRNEAAEALRDACVEVQSAHVEAVDKPAEKAAAAAQRLIEVCTLWNQLQ